MLLAGGVGSPAVADGSSHCAATTVLSCPQLCGSPRRFGSALTPALWEERTAPSGLHGGIPDVPPCLWSRRNDTRLVLWQWRCRKFTAVIKGCRLSDT